MTTSRRAFLEGTLGSLGVCALAGCGGDNNNSSHVSNGTQLIATQATSGDPPPEPAAIGSPGYTHSTLTLQPGAVANIVATPNAFVSEFLGLSTGSNAAAAAYVRPHLGAPFVTLSDEGAAAIYASMVSAAVAPQGNPSYPPIPATLSQLLQLKAMNCGHYCKLTTLLSLLLYPTLIPPDVGTKPTVHFVVWLGNVPLNTGVHSELVFANVLDNAYLLLEPMYGFAVRIPYLASGPRADLTVIENAATCLQTPISAENVLLLERPSLDTNPTALRANASMLETMVSGRLGPQYIYHDSIYGSEGWDAAIAQALASLV